MKSNQIKSNQIKSNLVGVKGVRLYGDYNLNKG